MKGDAFLGSVYAGMVAAIACGLVRLVSIIIGLQSTTLWGAAAGIFLPLKQTITPLGILIGCAGHLLIGAIFGIGFFIILLFSGIEQSILKGVLMGCFAWFVSAVMMRWGVTSYTYFNINEQLWTLMDLLVFGASLGYLVPLMAMQGASRSYPILYRLQERRVARPACKPMHAVEERGKDNGDA